MPQANRTPFIPNTKAGTITDSALDHMIEVGENAQANDNLDHHTAMLMFMTWPQLARELRMRRQVMSTIKQFADFDNITVLAPGRG